jgi:hypothetical protein
VRIWAASRPVIETSRDQANRDAPILALVDPVVTLDQSKISAPVVAEAGSPHLATVRGYLHVTLVVTSRDLEMPLRVGAKVVAGPWTVELIDIEASGGGNFARRTDLFLGIEPHDKTSPPVPTDLESMIRLCDMGGLPLARQGVSEQSATATGGVRQDLGFSWLHGDQNDAKPARILITAPLETKEAILPFEFKDIQMP